MSSKKSIEVVIVGKVYPMSINADEEPLIRQAVKNIEDSMNFFTNNYAITHKQDPLAMTALQMAVYALENEEKVKDTSQTESLQAILNMLTDYREQSAN